MEDNMTDKQFDILLKSIIQIVKDADTKEEAVEKWTIVNKVNKKIRTRSINFHNH